MASKERITPPSRTNVNQAAKQAPKGSGVAGWVLSEASVAKRERVKRPNGK